MIAANIVSTDPLLAFFDTLAMYAFVEARARDPAQSRRWYVLMWLGWGLAFLTKGPPALLPLLAAVLFLACHDRRRLREVFVPAGLLLFAVVAFTWFGILVARHPGLLGYFLGYEVYDRVFTAAHDRNSQWYGAFEVYLPVLAVGMLPWSVLALVAAGGPRSAWSAFRDRLRRRDPDWLLLAWWLLLPLAVFFLARSRLQLYVLPLFVPLALMTARALVRWPWLSARSLAWTAGVAAVALLGLKGAIAHVRYDRDARIIGRGDRNTAAGTDGRRHRLRQHAAVLRAEPLSRATRLRARARTAPLRLFAQRGRGRPVPRTARRSRQGLCDQGRPGGGVRRGARPMRRRTKDSRVGLRRRQRHPRVHGRTGDSLSVSVYDVAAGVPTTARRMHWTPPGGIRMTTLQRKFAPVLALPCLLLAAATARRTPTSRNRSPTSSDCSPPSRW